MSSPVGHALIGIGLAAVVAQVTGTPGTAALWLGAAVASNLPDLDWAGVLLGLPTRRVHRQATHSLVTLLGVVVAAGWAWSKLPGGLDPGLGLAWSVALLSHPALDVLTTSPGAAARGYGIPLLWPMLPRRWSLRRPIFSSAELSACRSLGDVWRAVLREIYTLGPAFAVLVVLGQLLRLGSRGLA